MSCSKTLEINTPINEILKDKQHVWVLFESDIEILEANNKNATKPAIRKRK